MWNSSSFLFFRWKKNLFFIINACLYKTHIKNINFKKTHFSWLKACTISYYVWYFFYLIMVPDLFCLVVETYRINRRIVDEDERHMERKKASIMPWLRSRTCSYTSAGKTSADPSRNVKKTFWYIEMRAAATVGRTFLKFKFCKFSDKY